MACRCGHDALVHERTGPSRTGDGPCQHDGCGCSRYDGVSYGAPMRPRPQRARMRLTSAGRSGPATKVEVITEHGAVIDISHLVQGASWSISYDERALVTLHIRGAEVTIVDPSPEKDPANEAPAEVLRSLAMARRDGRLDEALRDALALYGVTP